MRAILRKGRSNAIRSALKRALDIIGSTLAIFLQFPLLCLIALLVKLTSRGPVLFRQRRRGQFGRPFTLLKFRSMYVENDLKLWQDFVENGDFPGRIDATSRPVYQMTGNPRVTPFGRFLRRTSLDELPEFFNVLKGDMSLVGPRPPMEHGYETYDTVSRPPGSLLGQWAEWFQSPKTVQYIVNPIIADLQANYFEALAQRRVVKANWVRLRGYWDLFKALGLAGVVKMILQVWKSVR